TGVRVGRRKHEGGLGQPRPARDRLHGRVVESFGIEHHAEWVAGAGAIGEDVELQVTALRHMGAGLWSGVNPRFHPRARTGRPLYRNPFAPMPTPSTGTPWAVLKFGGTSVSQRHRWDT